MAFIPKTKQEKILHRLQIARGHIEKVLQMYKNQDSCIDVLHQSHAVQKALQAADHLLLENHLETCVIADIRAGNSSRAIAEIMDVVKKSDE